MKIDTDIGNVKDVVINITVSATIEEWGKIGDVLYEHVKDHYYGSPQWLYDRISSSIRKVKNMGESQNFDITKQ